MSSPVTMTTYFPSFDDVNATILGYVEELAAVLCEHVLGLSPFGVLGTDGDSLLIGSDSFLLLAG